MRFDATEAKTLHKESREGDNDMNMTRKFNTWVLKLKIWKDENGQDLIEYALMAGFVAVAAGAIMPGVAKSVSTIFSKVASTMSNAANQ
jgi:pilus assembly protein Flp/PilA